MPSTLTAVIEDGKQSKKIERNTRIVGIIEILLRSGRVIVLMFARGLKGAQLKVGSLVLATAAILKA
ncbi:hypothetical protein [Pseudomonas sp. PS02303]|uniref:hypothetical protein n=1 Tax=Pseudomonas sp. PS02303 TaxID=2991429 RepID=UPI00249CC485|nr:hypothetical protein [Pseudomonas sp. PS02303]